MESNTYPECNHRNGITLKPEKITEYLTNLVCEKCGEIIGSWETAPDAIQYISDDTLRKFV